MSSIEDVYIKSHTVHKKSYSPIYFDFFNFDLVGEILRKKWNKRFFVRQFCILPTDPLIISQGSIFFPDSGHVNDVLFLDDENVALQGLHIFEN